MANKAECDCEKNIFPLRNVEIGDHIQEMTKSSLTVSESLFTRNSRGGELENHGTVIFTVV